MSATCRTLHLHCHMLTQTGGPQERQWQGSIQQDGLDPRWAMRSVPGLLTLSPGRDLPITVPWPPVSSLQSSVTESEICGVK